jgi:gluconolactonase
VNLIEAVDARFRDLTRTDAEAVCLYDEGRWLEGPLWLPNAEELLFSDIPNDRVLRWSPAAGVSVFSTGGFQNGRALDARGHVIACEHGGRRVVRVNAAGGAVPLVTHHGGGRLNSPNDVIVHPDGGIWFTDPDYGILTSHEGYQAPSEQPACQVFRLEPGASEPVPLIDTMDKPNGLAFSPDFRWLYVADSGRSHHARTPAEIRRFEVSGGHTLVDAGVLATLDCGIPDGMAVDVQGNIWSSAGEGVHCFGPDGALLGKLRLGCVASNVCFGQSDHLFITTARRLFKVRVGVTGAAVPGMTV